MAKQLSDFEKAFAGARAKYKADKGTNPLDPKYNFDFKGKKYNVEYAEEKQARKGGKSSSASPSKSPDSSSSSSSSKPTGAPAKDRSKMTYAQMMEAGKDDPLVKENEKEREADLGEAKDTMKDVAIAGAELLLLKRLGGAGVRTAGRLAKYGKKLFGAGKDAASGVGKYRQGIRKVEGELLPREASQAASSTQKRLPGPSPQGKLRGPDNTPPPSGGAATPPPPPPPSGGAATRYQMRPTNATKADKAEAATRSQGKLPSPSASSDRADKLTAADRRRRLASQNGATEGERYQMRPISDDVEPVRISRRSSDIYAAAADRGYKKGGKVSKAKAFSAGESPAMVKKEMAFMRKKGAPKMGEAKGMKRMAKGGMSCMKKGGDVQKFAKGGSIDGCAVRGKTKLKRVKM